MDTTDPKVAWQQVCAPYTGKQLLVQALWLEIETEYSREDRHYHNLQHLGQLLFQANRYQDLIEDPACLEFAVFYHDIVYNPLSQANEEDSAALALERLQQLGVSEPEQAKVQRMILATKNHTAAAHADTSLLLDFDLFILAAPWEDYLRYSKSIRSEYHMVPDERYKKGRQKVLAHFLNLPRIYKTASFIELHERAARLNLKKELALLEGA